MHYIENIAFNWELNNIVAQENIENICNRIIQDRILPKFEQQLDAWDTRNPGMKCIIPEIEINILCTEFSITTIEHLLLRQFNYILEEKTKNATIQGKETSNNSVILHKADTVEDFLVEYLKTGIIKNTHQITAINEHILANKDFDENIRSKIIQIIIENIDASHRFVNLNTSIEKSVHHLFPKNNFHKNENFSIQLLEQLVHILFDKKDMNQQIEMWKTMVCSSNSIVRFVETLYAIIDPIVTYKKTKSEIIFSLSAILLQTICHFETKQSIAYHSLKANLSKICVARTNTTPSGYTNESESATNHISPKTTYPDKDFPNISEPERKTNTETTEGSVSGAQQKKENISIPKKVKDTNENIKTLLKDIYQNQGKRQNSSEQHFSTKIIGNNIGLFILHPFLKEFFTEVGILKGKTTINPNKGVQLLHYLATGNDLGKDISLSTEKIMMGLPIHQPVFNTEPLNNQEKEVCHELLKAVLKHWTVLEKSGIDTLRSMFLVREGTIEIKDKSIHIKARHLAQDVLLKKLPWGLGMVLLPWTKKMFQITWKS